ncbi:nucleotidyl transferase AbiEii/AbiGii toxin family protein [Ruania alba]|uniref:Nucleotidyl transferase AbiEii toxin, Type IV TA system n=1 Tax=Ruania alba TaxID=648782 RepID=A0A1H5LPP6_9MICO|nr:nucleotidyl transferase AbiEii/AbiGii toxin family protein [Ruania alba]SEE79055.1 Nucleotidyl transferase AbiEii toxin, Type IV TA system [Ruania alba]
MSPNPQHGTPAGDATIAIRGVARRTGGDVQELMTLYALEGLLARIAISEYRDDLVLKGGVLLAAFAARRPTKDIDLQATRLTSDPGEVAERVRAITALDVDDGLVFDPASVTATRIRDEDEYAGVRVKLSATLGTARLTVGIDVNFGDPIWPAPRIIDLPRVVPLGLPPVRLLGYPLTMVLAEKLVTAIDRGVANTRWRDFADVYTLTRLHTVNATELRASMEAVAEHRQVALRTLLPALASMAERSQQKWRAWRTRSHREDELPEAFADALTAVAGFADPVLSTTAEGDWNPAAEVWGNGHAR